MPGRFAAQWHGTDALELTYKSTNGAIGQQVIFRADQDKLSVAQSGDRCRENFTPRMFTAEIADKVLRAAIADLSSRGTP